MAAAELVLVLLLAIAVSGPLVRVTRVPAPFVQIALGALLAWPSWGVHVALDPGLFLLLFIPPLLFLDGLNAPKRELRALWLPIGSLAFGLVFFTIGVVGPALHWLVPSMPLPVAYAVAAVLSPTDAVALSSLVDRSRIPPHLMHMLEGEALLNDASGLVVFRYAVAATVTGAFSLSGTLGPFVLVAGGGVLAGFITMFGVAQAQRFLAKLGGIPSEAQVLVTLLLPFAAYLLAEHVEASGIIAAVSAGLLARWSGIFRHTGVVVGLQSTVLSVTIAFVFNGMVFLLLGLQLPDIVRAVPPELSSRHPVIEPLLVVLGLTLGLLAVRFVFAMGNSWIRWGVLRLRGVTAAKPSFDAGLALTFAGVRGAVTLAGVMSLPTLLPDGSAFPGRGTAIFLGAGVIVCSLIISALVMPWAARRLPMPAEDPREVEERIARKATATAAVTRIEADAENIDGPAELVDTIAERLIASYRTRMVLVEENDDGHHEARAAWRIELDLRMAAITAEREALHRLLDAKTINEEVANELFREVAFAEAMLRRKAERAG